MKIEYAGKQYQLDLTDIELKPAVVITGYMGMSLRQWGETLDNDYDPDGETVRVAMVDKPEFLKSMAAVFWLMLQQSGETCPIGDVNFKVGAFSEALVAAMAAEAQTASGPESEPDPTPPAGSEQSPEPASPTAPQQSTGGEVTADG